MSHVVRVNAGKRQITLPNGVTYDGQVDVTLTDAQFAQVRSALFPGTLTDLGAIVDPALDAVFASDAELASEASARTSADTTEATARGAETTRATGAETSEATARASADTTEATTRAAETTRATAAETAEASTRASADSTETARATAQEASVLATATGRAVAFAVVFRG